MGGSAGPSDEGFVLLETLVAISLISVVMAAFTTFFVNAVASTNQQRATQAATQIANSGVDTLRSLPASVVVTGRDASSVSAQFALASATVAPWLTSMSEASDSSAATSSGATAAVSTSGVSQTINNVAYTTNYYLGRCSVPTGVFADASCRTGGVATDVQYLRAVVAVTWSGGHCPPTKCTYVTATLLNAVDDPLFNLNAQPPAAPAVTNTDDQTSEVGDTVDLPLVFTASPPVTWTLTSGTLPAGLNLVAATGHIIGTPTAVTPSTPLTFTLSDFFARTTTVSFNWTVLPGLLISQPANQATVVSTAVTPLVLSASGGSKPYTWSDPTNTLPKGLSLSAGGTVTGTPTAVGVSPVVLTVTDATTKPTHSRTTTFSWTVSYPPFAATNPGAQTSTVDTPDTVTLSTTGGSGSFAWTGGASLPAGLTLTSAGVISGSPTTAGSTPTAVSLTATDTITREAQLVPFNWTVFLKPTVSSPGDPLATTLGATVGFPLVTTCPNAPCTYTLKNGPGTIAISASGAVSGTITGTAKTYPDVKFTVTDSAGATADSATFRVIVNPAPSLADPGDQTALEGTADTLAASVTGGTGPYTYSAANLPAWLALNPNTGLISGTAPATTQNATGITVTVRDSSGISNTTAPFSWLVGGPPFPPTAVTASSGNGTLALSWTAPTNSNGAAVTGYTVTTSPTSSGCTTTSATSCTIAGLTNGTAYTVAVTATNGFGTSTASTVVATPRPSVPGAPTGVTATGGDGTATVSWTAPAANGSAAVTGYTVTASPAFPRGTCSTTGALTCIITGLTNVTAYTVTVVASSGTQSSVPSSPATDVPRFTCKSAAIGANSYFTYPFAENIGTSAADVSGNSRPGTYTSAGVTYGATGPCPRDTPASKAVTLNGTTGGVTGAQSVNNPQVFSVGIWFKTNVAGGKLIGLGNQSTGLSGQYDRHIYIDTAGKLTFGVYPGSVKTVTSANSYTDNTWHYAVATLAPSSDANSGMRLYVDGALVATDSTTTAAEPAGTAYWRIGGDNLNGWPTGSNKQNVVNPTYVNGSLAFASAYTTTLTPAQILAQYHAGQ